MTINSKTTMSVKAFKKLQNKLFAPMTEDIKYLELLKTVATMRKAQKQAAKSKWGCSYDNKIAKQAEAKLDAMIQLEVGKSIQIVEAGKTLFE